MSLTLRQISLFSLSTLFLEVFKQAQSLLQLLVLIHNVRAQAWLWPIHK